MIDVNVYLGRWPFRRLPSDDTQSLAEMLRKQDVTEAWAGSFDGLLHRDVSAVNRRLVEACRKVGDGLLRPVGTVNPALPGWQDDLQQCAGEHRMHAVRLHPNYHGYTLDDSRFEELLALAEGAGLIVQITVRMEDDRTQHPLVQVPDVDVGPIPKLLDERPRLSVVLLNSLRTVRGALLEEFAQRSNVWFEIATLEGVGGVGTFIKQVPYRQVLFGSYAPFFYWQSAALKLDESELGETIRSAIETGNARRLSEQARSV